MGFTGRTRRRIFGMPILDSEKPNLGSCLTTLLTSHRCVILVLSLLGDLRQTMVALVDLWYMRVSYPL